MNGAQVIALYQRRGSVVEWEHAIPPPPDTIDPLTGGPRASLGEGLAGGVGDGNFGENFCAPVRIVAYFHDKRKSFSARDFGIVETGGSLLTFAVPYTPDWRASVLDRDSTPSADDYNAGRFAVLRGQTLAFDRFRIDGQLWLADALPTPIIDANVTIAWRLSVSKVGL